MRSSRRLGSSRAPSSSESRDPESTAAPGACTVGRNSLAFGGLLLAGLMTPACTGDSSPPVPESVVTETTADEEEPTGTRDASVRTPTEVEADDYCKHLCDRGKACNEDYDRQTCVRECTSESGVIGNLNPSLLAGLYECVDKTSCSTIEAERFIAACLADAASDVAPNSAGKALCKELETAADECSFTDFDERACWQVSSAYSDEVLESATICARKKCELIVDCLDATLKVPSELDGSPIGFDTGQLSSGTEARAATESFLPETSNASVSPETDPTTAPHDPTPSETVPLETDPARSNVTNATSETLATTTVPTLPPHTDTTPPGIDITDPDVQAEYCVDGDACSDCRFKACCLETLTCLTNDDCMGWVDCVYDCPTDAYACVEACRQTFAAGEVGALDYVNCMADAGDDVCAAQCTPDSTDTAGPATSDTASGRTSAAPDGSTSETPTLGPNPESSDAASDATEPATSPGTTEADAGADACGECLATLCDSEVDGCLADDGCYNLYIAYVYCWEDATSEEFVDCFTPYYSDAEPASASLFDDMTYCVGYAECADCAG